MPKLLIPANGWHPRSYQLPSWSAWENGCRRLMLCWHRRAGKDEVALHMAAVAAHLRPANYWHCLPQFSQARRAIWEAVNPHTGKKRIDEAFPKEIRATTRQDTMTIEFKSGAVWRVVGSDDPDSLVGAPPVGIVFSEWALSNPSAWAYLAPIVEENNGWAAFITTPRGKNHAYSMLNMARKSPEWFAEVLTVNETGYPIDRVEVQRSEYHSLFGADAGDALIQQEYHCSFEAAILGAYWGKEMAAAATEGRIGLLDPDPRYPLHTAWDLGAHKLHDTMVIWFWQALPDKTIKIVGCYAGHGYGIIHYADMIKEYTTRVKCQRGEDWVPHDARQIEMGSWETNPIDPNFGKAKQRIEVMIECGLNPRKVPDHHVVDGISAARQILPRCWFDEEGCGDGLEALRQYRTEWDDDSKDFGDNPEKNWATHYADAFRYLAMAYREVQAELPKQAPRGLVVGSVPPPNWQLPTYADILKLQSDEPKQRERI